MPICISSTTTEQLYWVYIEPVYKGVKIGPVESAASGSWSSTSCKRCPPFPRVMLIRKWEQLRRKNLMKDEPILPSHFPVRGLRQECLTNSVITKPVHCLFQVYMSDATYAWLYFLWSQYWWGVGGNVVKWDQETLVYLRLRGHDVSPAWFELSFTIYSKHVHGSSSV